MKLNKKKLSEGLLEAILEIVLTLIFFGIGALIISMFGVELDSLDTDGDLIVLIGIIVPIVLFGIVYALARFFKKTFGGKRK